MAGVSRSSSFAGSSAHGTQTAARIGQAAPDPASGSPEVDASIELQLLRQALLAAPVLAFTTDRSLRLVHANPALTRLAHQAGFEHVVGQPVLDVIRPADRDRWTQHYEAALAGTTVQVSEITELDQAYAFAITLTPVLGTDGTVIGLTGHLLDVTRQYQADQALALQTSERIKAQARAEAADRLLQGVLDSSTDQLLVLDTNLRLRYANTQYRETMGLGADAVGKSIHELHSAQDIQHWEGSWARALAGEAFRIEQTTAVAGQNRTYATHYHPIRNAQGEVEAIAISARDITDRQRDEAALVQLTDALATANEDQQRQQEEQRQQVDHMAEVQAELAQANEELQRQEEELRQQVDYMTVLQAQLTRQRDDLQDLTNTIPATIYRFETWDDGRIELPFMSRGVEEIFGCSQAEIRNDYLGTIRKLVHPEDWDGHWAAIQQAVRTVTPFAWEGRIVTPSGETKWIQSQGRPLRSATEPVTSWFGVVVDITKQKAFEGQLAQQQVRIESLAADLQQLTDNVPGLMFRHDRMADGSDRIGLISKGAVELLGISSEYLQAHPHHLQTLLHPADVFGYQRAVVRSVRTKTPLQWEGRLAGEPVRYIRILSNPQFDGLRNCWSWYGTIQDMTRKKQFEMDLAQEQRRVQRLANEQRQLIDNVPGMIYRIDQYPGAGADGIDELAIGFISEGARAVLGYEASELSPSYDTLIQKLVPEDRTRYLDQVVVHLTLKIPFHFEGRSVLPDGKQRWIRIHSRPVWDPTNSCYSWYGLVQDITQQREYAQELQQKTEELAAQQEELRAHLEALTQVEAELRRSEARLGKLLERIPAGVLVLDALQTPTFANQQARELLLPPGSDLQSMDASLHAEAFEPLIHGPNSPVQRAFEGQTAHVDGLSLGNPQLEGKPGQLAVTASPIYDDRGQLETVVVVFQDVTQRKRDEHRLRQTQQQLEAVLSTYPNILVTVDQSGLFNLSRGRGLERLGLRPEALLGQHYRTFNAQTPEIAEDYERALAGETFTAVRLYNDRTFDMTYTPLTDASGQPIGAVCIATDITEQRQFTAQLVRARLEAEEASRAKEVFLANMSHEIRTPLNGIIGLTGLLSQTPLDDQQRKYLNSLNLSAENLLVIINDILDFAKLRSGRYELEEIQFSLRRILDNLQPSFQPKLRERNNEFRLVLGADLPDQLLGDPYRLNQILLNLVSNAVKFTERGSVTVEVRTLELRPATARLLIEVRDTGIGIPAERMPLIFDQFTSAAQYTANTYGGTGLGLSIVQQLVHNMNGQLEVESLPGHGTTFRIELEYGLPVGDQPAVLASPRQVPLEGPPLRVLLVEDHPVNQLVAAEVLMAFNCQVTTADNGLIALDILRREVFDAILMDIRMPELDGYQTTLIIRRDLPAPNRDVPIIAMTAHAFPEERDKCFQMGMNDYLSKPYNSELLVAKLVKHTRLATTLAPTRQRPAMSDPDRKGYPYSLQTLNTLFRGREDSIRQFLEAALEQLEEACPLLNNPELDPEELANHLHKLKTTFRFLELTTEAAEAERLEHLLTEPDSRSRYDLDLRSLSDLCVEVAASLRVDPLLQAS